MNRIVFILLLVSCLASMGAAAPAPRIFSVLQDALNSIPQSYASGGKAEIQVNGKFAPGDWGAPRVGIGVAGSALVTNVAYLFDFTNGWGQLEFKDDNPVNVRHFGAVDDPMDESTDSTVPLLSAIEYAGARSSVYLPLGRYIVSAPLGYKSLTTIYGEGKGSMISSVHGGAVFQNPNPSERVEEVAFQNFAINTAGGARGYAAITWTNASYARAEKIFIHAFDGKGFQHGIKGWGDSPDGGAWSSSIVGCTIYAYAYPNTGPAYAIHGSGGPAGGWGPNSWRVLNNYLNLQPASVFNTNFTEEGSAVVYLENFNGAMLTDNITEGYYTNCVYVTNAAAFTIKGTRFEHGYNVPLGRWSGGTNFVAVSLHSVTNAVIVGNMPWGLGDKSAVIRPSNPQATILEPAWGGPHTIYGDLIVGKTWDLDKVNFLPTVDQYMLVDSTEPITKLGIGVRTVDAFTNNPRSIMTLNANPTNGLSWAGIFHGSTPATIPFYFYSSQTNMAITAAGVSVLGLPLSGAELTTYGDIAAGPAPSLWAGSIPSGPLLSITGATNTETVGFVFGIQEPPGAPTTNNLRLTGGARGPSQRTYLQSVSSVGSPPLDLMVGVTTGAVFTVSGASVLGHPVSGAELTVFGDIYAGPNPNAWTGSKLGDGNITITSVDTNSMPSVIVGHQGGANSRVELVASNLLARLVATSSAGAIPLEVWGGNQEIATFDATAGFSIFPGLPFSVGADTITDITGYGLTVVTGALTANVAGLTWVNVRKHGATGDGITDDTAAVISSIAAAGSGTVYFPRGVYSITNTLYVTNNAVTIRGDGPDSSTIWMRSNGPAMYVGFPGFDGGFNDYSRHQFILEDFGVRGVSGVTNQVGIQFSAASRIALTRVFAETFGDEHEKGFFFERWAWWISVQNCKMFDCWIGLLASGNTTNVNIPENSFNAADFSGNTFRVGRYGIILGDPLYSPDTPLLPTAYAVGIRNNSIENFGELGVWVASPWSCIVDNNYIENSPIGVRIGATNWTSRVYDQAKNVSIKNNHIYTLTNSASSGLVLQDEKTCIQIQGGLFATIKENNFMGYKRAAVEIQSTGVKQTSVDGNSYYNYAEVPRVIGPFTNGVAGNSFFHRWLGESWIGSGTNGPDELINNIVIDGSTNLFRAQVVLTNKPLQFAHGANDWKLSKFLDENRGLFHGGFSVSNGGINLLSTNGAGYALAYKRDYDPVQRTVIPQDGTLLFSDGTFDPDVGIGYAGATGWLRMWTNIQGYGHISAGPNPSIWSGYTKYGDRGIYHTSTETSARPEVLIGYQDGTTNQRVGIAVSNRVGIISALASLGGSEIRFMVDDQHAATVTNAGVILPSGKSLNIGGENVTDLSGTNLIVAGNKLNVYGLAAEGHTHDASNTVSGQFDSARLGGGTSETDTFLRGGDVPVWDQLSADDIPNLPASRITSGTFDPARLGTGTATTNTFLQGDGSGGAFWGTVPSTPSPTNGIADAPADGIFYGRRNNAWTQPDISDLSGVSSFGLSWIDGTVVDSVDALDELGLTGGGPATIDSPAKYAVRVGSGGTVSTRHRLNLIAATGLTLAISDDAVNDESDVTVSIADRDWGDITSTSSGSVWNIDADAVGSSEIATDAVGANEIASNAVGTAEIDDNAVTYAKIQNVTADRILGRGAAAGDGDPQELTIGNGLKMTGTEIHTNPVVVTASRLIGRGPGTDGVAQEIEVGEGLGWDGPKIVNTASGDTIPFAIAAFTYVSDVDSDGEAQTLDGVNSAGVSAVFQVATGTIFRITLTSTQPASPYKRVGVATIAPSEEVFRASVMDQPPDYDSTGTTIYVFVAGGVFEGQQIMLRLYSY